MYTIFHISIKTNSFEGSPLNSYVNSRYLADNQDIIRIKYDILCLCSFLLEPSLCPRESDSFKNNPITNLELAVEM